MRQRARETGALPTGLVRPGQVFEWHTLEPWADPVTEQEALADIDEQIAKAKAEESVPEASGFRVVPGKSEPAPMDRSSRRGRPLKAATPDKF
jgi:hypothetical protein